MIKKIIPATDKNSSKQSNTCEKYYVYIPENLDINKLIEDNPPNFKYYKDCFLYLIHLITYIPSKNKDKDMDYVPFYSPLIQRKIKNYRLYLDYLVKNKILIENKQYIVGKKSKGYRLATQYQTPIKPIAITKKTLIKSIFNYIKIKNKSITDEYCDNNNNQDLHYIIKWFDEKLIIDFKRAKHFLEELREKELMCFNTQQNAMMRFNSGYLPLLKLHRKEFLYTVDTTAGRLHSVLTQLKGDLRQFITYESKLLVAVDIANSQPYLSCVFFNKEKFIENRILPMIQSYNKSYNKKEIRKKLCTKIENIEIPTSINQFIEITKSGKLYDEFGTILLGKGIITDDTPIRKQAKEIIFSSIFSPNQSIAYNNVIKIFKGLFPDVYEIYRVIKQTEHRTLACTLQNLEANLVLHTACKIISEQRPEIPLFTLHDAIITTEGNEEYVKEILYNVLLNAIDIPPTLNFERWKKVA